MDTTSRRALLAMFAAPALSPDRAGTQDFPARSLTWVVPYPPGNIAAAATRIIS